MFRGPKLLRTHYRLIGGVSLVERRDNLLIDAPTHFLALISQLELHTPLPVEPTPFLLPTSRTMPKGGSIMLLWRKPRKLQMLSLLCFPSTPLMQLFFFYSGASHSFISTAYVEKHNLPIALLKCQMIVSSPGEDMSVRQLCLKVNLKIRGVDFVANLIVLESKGIDVILGMD
jgi:hypothetical protein